ncbi:protein MIZU-KUSSEI 1-like [Impatiens glandulifera]|uniref:protein MIZU-KUSSEI 1-like n=1 Tax=Impatiens glandulifera TaxID=253017 RepID=UPI001FB129E7|nr:protein MIZU-KUSSEI 1-like [Impatiens glandulifera]
MIFNEHVLTTLPRTSSCNSTKRLIIPLTYKTSSLPLLPHDRHRRSSSLTIAAGVTSFLRSIITLISLPLMPSFKIISTTCRWLTISTITPTSLRRQVTGTLFGNRRGLVSFAIQFDPRSQPVFVIEFAVTTSALVKEMSSGFVRIALESEKPDQLGKRVRSGKLFGEPLWTMYCNGKKCGSAISREWTESDWHVLSTVKSVSVGAGVIPVLDNGYKKGNQLPEGELLYMRAKFERVVCNRDSEAFYMLNPDGNAGPELGIFLLRI